MSEVGDIIDRANDHAQAMLDAHIAAARHDIKPGVEGECELCGEWSARLINHACAPCRDRHHLP